MVRCHLSEMMGKKKVKIADVARELDLNRSTVSALYYDRAQKVDFAAIEKLCIYFGCGVGDMLEIVSELSDGNKSPLPKP